jgi:hypothetical protein
MTSRDPRNDPQPGDELRSGSSVRLVIHRKDERLMVRGQNTSYWIRLDSWQKWCAQGGTEVVTGVDQEG